MRLPSSFRADLQQCPRVRACGVMSVRGLVERELAGHQTRQQQVTSSAKVTNLLRQDGDLFVIRNEEACCCLQNWFWRRQYVDCFHIILCHSSEDRTIAHHVVSGETILELLPQKCL